MRSIALGSRVGAALATLAAAGCAPPEEERGGPRPELPAEDDAVVLGAAGAPRPLFGPDDAPTFAAAFGSLADDGFNRFMPVFLTSESGAGTQHPSYFLPPAALPGVDASLTCSGPHNPWAELPGDLRILFPTYLLALDQPATAVLDTGAVGARFVSFESDCLAGDESLVGGLYLQDEPAAGYLASTLDDGPETWRLENVAALASVSRATIDAPTVLVEAAVPFALPYWGVPPDDAVAWETTFWEGVEATAPAADEYGFDLYAVDLTTDMGPIGEYVDVAQTLAPSTHAVLQGFGYADMDIDNGTAGRQPTRAETRAMAFTALAAGARALHWYGQSALTMGEDDAVWEDVRELVRDLRAISGVLGLPDAAGVEIEGTRVRGLVKDGNDVRWLLLVNPTDQPGEVAVELPPDTTCVRDALSGDSLADASGSRFVRTLSPYETRVVGICRFEE